MNIKYPTRCKIIDADGLNWNDFTCATPEKSKPHIGKTGLAEKDKKHGVKITLDDGNIIYGYDCWWIPIKDAG